MPEPEKSISVPIYLLADVVNTLRMTANTLDSSKRETCLDRNIMRTWNEVADLLHGKSASVHDSLGYYMNAGQVPDNIESWISVEERYPDFDKAQPLNKRERYLVRVVSGSAIQKVTYAVAWLTGRYKFCNEMDWVRVTHWMPIPHFPEQPITK